MESSQKQIAATMVGWWDWESLDRRNVLQWKTGKKEQPDKPQTQHSKLQWTPKLSSSKSEHRKQMKLNRKTAKNIVLRQHWYISANSTNKWKGVMKYIYWVISTAQSHKWALMMKLQEKFKQNPWKKWKRCSIWSRWGFNASVSRTKQKRKG